MKVYLLKNVEKIGMAGELLNVSDGFAANYLIPKKLAVQITPANEHFYHEKKKTIEHRKEVVATATSMLAETIKTLNLVVKRKMHDNGKLYGAISPAEIADMLMEKAQTLGLKEVKISKNQIICDKSIKQKGSYEIGIKLSTRLQPKIKLTVLPE